MPEPQAVAHPPSVFQERNFMNCSTSIMLTSGDVTSARGFLAAGTHCGIRPDRPDLALITCQNRASAAGMFTQNQVCAAPVKLCRENVADGFARAVLVNSGNANACTGQQGMADAREMVELAALSLGIEAGDVLLCSTGVIGQALPMEKIRQGIPRLKQSLSEQGGEQASQAILTTDAFAKTCAATVTTSQGTYTLGGMAKGAGMIHPNMATTLCFITCDAEVAPQPLRAALKAATDASFNSVSVDGDTSTNDTILLLASGSSGVKLSEPSELEQFTQALTLVAQDLAKKVVRDGEGARCLVEVRVTGASSDRVADQIARTVCGSLLFKTMLAGAEPNWGRVLAAAGRAGVPFCEESCRLSFGGVCVYSQGRGLPENQAAAAQVLQGSEFEMVLELGQGSGSARRWTCDIGHGYVELNGAYMT
jgi:glutamate N-acetyltransferase/amino-acid N-acetyltransferase